MHRLGLRISTIAQKQPNFAPHDKMLHDTVWGYNTHMPIAPCFQLPVPIFWSTLPRWSWSSLSENPVVFLLPGSKKYHVRSRQVVVYSNTPAGAALSLARSTALRVTADAHPDCAGVVSSGAPSIARRMTAKTCHTLLQPLRRRHANCPCVSELSDPFEGAAVRSTCLVLLLVSTSAFCRPMQRRGEVSSIPRRHDTPVFEARSDTGRSEV